MFDELFKRKKIVPSALLSYGFVDEGEYFGYKTEIRNGEFILFVRFDRTGTVDTDLAEVGTGEPYVLYKTNAVGAFVGEIRTEIETVLSEIADKCFEPEIFKSKQALTAIRYVREMYGDEPEFLWPKFPDNAIFRRKDSKKWYGAILTVEGKKIGLSTEQVVEIIDLRMLPKDAETVLARANYYPGWHMNKKSWYTLVLDGGVSDKELKQRIDESYELAIK